MKSLIFIFSIFALSCLVMASVVGWADATPARVDDGVLHFAISTVGGTPAFTQSEQDGMTGTIIALTPQSFEVNLSTCLVIVIDGKLESGFASYQDWLDCQTKAGLKRKVRKIRDIIDSMSDLPLADSKDLKERAGWIKSYYQTLP